MRHSHAPRDAAPVSPAVTRVLLATTVGLALAVLAGLVLLWPQGGTTLPPSARLLAPGATVQEAEVRSLALLDCQSAGSVADAEGRYSTVRCGKAELDVGGTRVSVDVPPSALQAGLGPGTGVRVVHVPATAQAPESWQYYDLERSVPLVALALCFAVVTVAVARLRGLAALAGLVVAYAVLAVFLLPALVAGGNALAVGVVGSGAILLVVLYLAHGLSARTTCALLGTFAGLAACAGLGSLAITLTHLTGSVSQEQLLLGSLRADVSPSGIVLCGLVLAALGALNDVTVTQASAVWELHAAEPTTGRRRLFGSAMRIGRDHIASTVYTLAFAYAGTALPVLLLLQLQQVPVGVASSSEQISTEIVSSLVSGLGVVLAVPLTTAVAVLARTAGRAPRRGSGRHGGLPAGRRPARRGSHR